MEERDTPPHPSQTHSEVLSGWAWRHPGGEGVAQGQWAPAGAGTQARGPCGLPEVTGDDQGGGLIS